MADDRNYRLGALVERLHYRSMDYWRVQYAPESTLADLLAGPVTCITDELVSWPGGKVQVITSIHSRRKHQDETYFLRAQRVGADEYRVVHASVRLK